MNESIGKSKSLGELTDDERVGLINWAKVEKLMTTTDESEMKKIRNWVNFHRSKNDIQFSIISEELEASSLESSIPPLFSWSAKTFSKKSWDKSGRRVGR